MNFKSNKKDYTAILKTFSDETKKEIGKAVFSDIANEDELKLINYNNGFELSLPTTNSARICLTTQPNDICFEKFSETETNRKRSVINVYGDLAYLQQSCLTINENLAINFFIKMSKNELFDLRHTNEFFMKPEIIRNTSSISGLNYASDDHRIPIAYRKLFEMIKKLEENFSPDDVDLLVELYEIMGTLEDLYSEHIKEFHTTLKLIR